MRKVLRLSDIKMLEDSLEEEKRLWPAHPDRVTEMEEWNRGADDLSSRLEDHRRSLVELRKNALDYDEEAQRHDRQEHPLWERLQGFLLERRRLAQLRHFRKSR